MKCFGILHFVTPNIFIPAYNSGPCSFLQNLGHFKKLFYITLHYIHIASRRVSILSIEKRLALVEVGQLTHARRQKHGIEDH
jgi:hypothetical protein